MKHVVVQTNNETKWNTIYGPFNTWHDAQDFIDNSLATDAEIAKENSARVEYLTPPLKGPHEIKMKE